MAQGGEILKRWKDGAARFWRWLLQSPPPPMPMPPLYPPARAPTHLGMGDVMSAELERGDMVDDEVTQLFTRIAPERGRGPVTIANRADGGIFYWLLKLYAFAGLVLVAALCVVAVVTYGRFAAEAPPTPDLGRYAEVVPAVSRIYAADGTLLGEFAAEWREVVPYEKIPPKLIDAFLAAEDHEFFEHNGIYFKGILRAAWRNVVAGDFAQGGSTITQQVAKQFLGAEKSLTRKAKEAIVARRLEATYSKRAILAVYLNHIFLGSGNYGVRAAALRYFGKKLEQLDVSEMALIAGLAQAPSTYSPVTHPERAKERRDEILAKMVRYGFLSHDAAVVWQQKPLLLKQYTEVFGDRLPYYADHVGSYVRKKYGEDALMKQGLRVETAAEPVTEAIAYHVVDQGARKQDKRQGWRGPEAHLDEGKPRDTFRQRSARMYGAGPLHPGRRYLGMVEELTNQNAKVLVGETTYDLPVENARWAATWSRTDATNDRSISSLKSALEVGDVIWVSRDEPVTGEFDDWHAEGGGNPRWKSPFEGERLERLQREADERVQLEQVPHPQSVIFTADHKTAYVVAMVGGTDHDRSVYNRAVHRQACRQPGSTYKPIYYSAALDEGYGFDTSLSDVPRGEVNPVTGEIWVPRNLGGTVDFVVNMEYAMVYSKNIPSLGLFKKVGADNVEKWARRLGFTTRIIADRALALGASCTILDELTRAFAIFARNGTWRSCDRKDGKLCDWIYVRRIFDRSGNVIEDNTVYYDPQLSPVDRLDRLAATAGQAPVQAIPARAAFLTNKLLSQVIEHGFSSIVRKTGIVAAGKTGTSSATMDTTFLGYTSRWITTVWMGDDMRERPLGSTDAAYIVVEPVWARYMVEAAAGHPNKKIPWEVPPGVDPDDRGEHSKGGRTKMSLVYRERSGPPPPDLPPIMEP